MKIMTLHGTNKVFCLVLKYHFPFYPRPDSRVGTEAGANEGFATKTHGEISFGVFGSGNLGPRFPEGKKQGGLPEKHKFPRPFFYKGPIPCCTCLSASVRPLESAFKQRSIKRNNVGPSLSGLRG